LNGNLERNLQNFVDWSNEHITGDEKGEAQIFLDRFFQALGHKGLLEIGGKPEFRVRKKAEDGGGVAFADYVWKPTVLIEMKKRGAKLSSHFRQAFDYWTRLVPNRPRYVILCNFDEFWIYDFETQMDEPVDKVLRSGLSERYGPLQFLLPSPREPIFGNRHESVTRAAADRLAQCYNNLVTRKIDEGLAQRFILQTLVALFAEDIGLLDRYTVLELLKECSPSKNSYDLFGGLFTAMNNPSGNKGGRFSNVRYFNGGVFAEPAYVELSFGELQLLKEAAEFDWSKVRPEIFGTLFEHSLREKERHTLGAHFTSPADIMKIVGPTIVEPWRELIDAANTRKELVKLHERMRSFTVLDPACGSGNFLYLAYRELKRLERVLVSKIAQTEKKADEQQMFIGYVTPQNFYGIDILPLAIEIAKVTMLVGRKLAIDELQTNEQELPLDNLNKNFSACDALVDNTGNRVEWPKADVIIGNPPFLGAKLLKPERGEVYVRALRRAYPEVPGMADYCVYWFRRAHDHLSVCDRNDSMAGRAGLVGTQNIRNNKSRVGGLDHIVKTGIIIEAVENQSWSGEANVHVSIANWVKTTDNSLVPENRRLWFDSRLGMGKKKGKQSAIELDFRNARVINSSLSDQVDLSEAKTLSCNATREFCTQGITPGHSGFVLKKSEYLSIINRDENSKVVIFPYLIGRELVTENGKPSRFLIDFRQMSITDAQSHTLAFRHVQEKVLPTIAAKAKGEVDQDNARRNHLEKWWQHWRSRNDLIQVIQGLPRYLVCSRVTKRPIFVFVSSSIRPGDALQVFTFDDNYSFGILQSSLHWQWFLAKCSKFKSDFRYTPESVFQTFPWPQSPESKSILAVSDAAHNLQEARNQALRKTKGGLREIYKTSELPGRSSIKEAHAELDRCVVEAYGFNASKDPLEQLLKLNYDVYERLISQEAVMPPGIPLGFTSRQDIVSKECIT